MRRSPMSRTYRNTGPSPEVVEACLERAGYCCEVCAVMLGDRRGEDWSYQHRRPRQMGGTRWPGINLPSNGLICCGSATTGCHGDIESHRATAARAGYLVLSRADPAMVAVLIRKERWTYLTDEATYADHPPSECAS